MNPNPSPRPPSARLKALVDRRLAGTITRVELAELETHLLTPHGMAYYLQCTDLEASLTLAARSRSAPRHPAVRTPAPSLTPSSRLRSNTSPQTGLLAIAATLVLLLAVAALLSVRREAPQPPAPAVAATLLRHLGPPGPAANPPLNRELRVGETATLDAGLTEWSTPGRATLLVEGPARLCFPAPGVLRLERGRAFLRVLDPARPLAVEHPPLRLSAASGEFVLERDPGRGITLAGALEGKLTLASPATASPVVLERGRVLEIPESGGSPPRRLPLEQDRFHRQFPSRDLPWSAPPESFEPCWIEQDISALVWGPGEYLARFKWTHGADALLVARCELLLDGAIVSSDSHPAFVGDPTHTRDPGYALHVPPDRYRRGKWTLRSLVRINPRAHGQVQIPLAAMPVNGGVVRADDPRLGPLRQRELVARPALPDSHGLLLVDPAPSASIDDACGTWEYSHEGGIFRRTFLPDGSARFEVDGTAMPNLDAASWTLDRGVLTLTVLNLQTRHLECVERHLIRPDGSLIFLDRPYANARKIPPANGGR